MCPVLVLRDPEIEEILSWFTQCYDLEIHPLTGRVYWHRVHLPEAGSIGEQDARLVFGMELVAFEKQCLLDEDAKRERRKSRHE